MAFLMVETAHPGWATGSLGLEWLVDAHGCSSEALRSVEVFRSLFDQVVRDLDLHAIGEPIWHQFPGNGGLSGVLLLHESHLTCHTFPERGVAAFNLYCCRARRPWPWQDRLARALGARWTEVTTLERGRTSVESLTEGVVSTASGSP